MSQTNKRKRKEENCFDQSADQMSQNKVTTLTGEFSDVSDQQTFGLQQPIFLNQIPLVQNQQLVYQVEGVQNLNNLNFSNGNGQQNFVYIVIPTANENVQIETLPVEVLKKDEKEDGVSMIEFIKPEEQQPVKEVSKGEKYFSQIIPQQQHYEASPPKKENIYILGDQQISYSQPATSSSETTPNNKQAVLRTHGYKCDYPPCTLAFSSIYEKKAHMDVHLFPESTEFKCNICNQVFSKASDRNKHVETHAVVSTFKCKNCNVVFPYYTSLVKHIDENRCVQKNKLHVCYFCGSKFVNHADLERHHEGNLKVCVCKAKICGEQSFEVHTNLCSAYKAKMNKCKKKMKTNESVVVVE